MNGRLLIGFRDSRGSAQRLMLTHQLYVEANQFFLVLACLPCAGILDKCAAAVLASETQVSLVPAIR